MFKIETLSAYGIWTDEIGTGENAFETEADALAMVQELRTIGEDWAKAEYRVVAIEGSTTMEREIIEGGRRFTIRAYEVDGGYTESIAEHSETFGADWDGSGVTFSTAEECLDAMEKLVREQIETDAENAEQFDTDDDA